MNTGSKLGLGVLAGFAAGALLGVLFAPAKGSETRKKIAGRGRDVVDGVKESFADIKDSVTGTIESAGNLVSGLTEQIGAKPELVKKEANNTQPSNEKNHQNSVPNQNRH